MSAADTNRLRRHPWCGRADIGFRRPSGFTASDPTSACLRVVSPKFRHRAPRYPGSPAWPLAYSLGAGSRFLPPATACKASEYWLAGMEVGEPVLNLGTVRGRCRATDHRIGRVYGGACAMGNSRRACGLTNNHVRRSARPRPTARAVGASRTSHPWVRGARLRDCRHAPSHDYRSITPICAYICPPDRNRMWARGTMFDTRPTTARLGPQGTKGFRRRASETATRVALQPPHERARVGGAGRGYAKDCNRRRARTTQADIRDDAFHLRRTWGRGGRDF